MVYVQVGVAPAVMLRSCGLQHAVKLVTWGYPSHHDILVAATAVSVVVAVSHL